MYKYNKKFNLMLKKTCHKSLYLPPGSMQNPEYNECKKEISFHFLLLVDGIHQLTTKKNNIFLWTDLIFFSFSISLNFSFFFCVQFDIMTSCFVLFNLDILRWMNGWTVVHRWTCLTDQNKVKTIVFCLFIDHVNFVIFFFSWTSRIK